jgi:hypothetical protein
MNTEAFERALTAQGANLQYEEKGLFMRVPKCKVRIARQVQRVQGKPSRQSGILPAQPPQKKDK